MAYVAPPVREAFSWLIHAPRDVSRTGPARATSRWLILVAGVLAILLIDAVDYLTRGELHLEIFYVFPIGAIAWWLGRRTALAVGALTAMAWYLTDRFTGQQHGHTLVPVWNAMLRVAYFGWVAYVLGRLRRALQREKWLANRDALTEVLNSRAFHAAVATEIERCRRYGHTMSLAYVDVDDFKRINDLLGHKAGDDMLRSTAGTMRASLRAVDIVARIGGDEFAVLLPETDAASARAAMQKVRAALRAALDPDPWHASVSIGISTFEQPPPGVDQALQRADAMMYESKRSGKDAIRAEVATG